MDPSNQPIELISYRGLLKSLESIKNGFYFEPNTGKDVTKHKKESKPFNLRLKMINSIKKIILLFLNLIITSIEKSLYFMMHVYDNFVYTPLQNLASPIVKLVPRYVSIGSNFKLTVFNANIVTLSRTILVIPIAWFLKYDYNFMAFMCVVLHDFLDHIDGIVAKVHKVTYPNHDDPVLGGFLDAFCDKIVNVLSIWTILQSTNYDLLTNHQLIVYLLVCYGVIFYETIIGIVRVQDYFLAKFKKDFNIEDKSSNENSSSTTASMEGKLKEKLESIGIACLCLTVSKTNPDPFYSISGLTGIVCLSLALRMAHKSLSLKLKARNFTKNKTKIEKTVSAVKISSSVDNLLHLINSSECETTASHPNFESAEMKMVDYSNNQIKEHENNYKYNKIRQLSLEDKDVDSKLDSNNTDNTIMLNSCLNQIDNRVDKVYTIGCFDLFHYGHVKLINRMRELGKKVVVGVHDSRSIYKLKKRVPVDSTEKRMLNVKTVADEVFCIAGCDPSNFMTCIVNLDKNEKALYVRGDDMPDFPSRQVVENLMPIKFLPYTHGVSTTKLRKEKYSHIAPDDEAYLEKIN